MSRRTHHEGFTLIELLIAMAVSLLLIGVVVAIFRQALGAASFMTDRAEVQQNSRAALNQIAHDITLAGVGMPVGGIALPAGTTAHGKFACDSVTCYVVNDAYPNDRIYSVTPGHLKGINTDNGTPTDVITVAYQDTSINLVIAPDTVNNNITAAGEQVTFSPSSMPPINDPKVGLMPGDVIVFSNNNGNTAAMVTAVDGITGNVSFAASDYLAMNQPTATSGNIVSLANAGSNPVTYPGTRAFRILPVTYYLQLQPNGSRWLMRQVAGHPPTPVVENVLNLTFSYDIFDANTNTPTANLADANGQYNSIKKVNFSVTVSSSLSDQQHQRDALALTTSVSPRSLGVGDRYQ